MNTSTYINKWSEEGGQTYFNVFSTIYLASVVVLGSTLNIQALFLLRDATKVSCFNSQNAYSDILLTHLIFLYL